MLSTAEVIRHLSHDFLLQSLTFWFLLHEHTVRFPARLWHQPISFSSSSLSRSFISDGLFFFSLHLSISYQSRKVSGWLLFFFFFLCSIRMRFLFCFLCFTLLDITGVCLLSQGFWICRCEGGLPQVPPPALTVWHFCCSGNLIQSLIWQVSLEDWIKDIHPDLFLKL